jgi:hypothetical protein
MISTTSGTFKSMNYLNNYSLAIMTPPLAVVIMLFSFVGLFGVSGQEKPKMEVNLIVDDSSTSKQVKTAAKAIKDWYAKNIKAFEEENVSAIMDLRTEDFRTVGPNGTGNTKADMQAYTVRLLDMIEGWLLQDIQVGKITLRDKVGEAKGKFASAYVTQKTIRLQRLQDGRLHRVQSGAVQRETWKETPKGWKLYFVDDVRDAGLYIDGNMVRAPQ